MIEVPPFVFVVDTAQYAGNFERELCAYATGIIGDCEVGEDEAALFEKEYAGNGDNPFEDIIAQTPDKRGCNRPVALWSTPGWINNGMGGYFKICQRTEAQAHYRQACLEESRKQPFDSDVGNIIHERDWEAKAQSSFESYPALMSVGIYLYEEPKDFLISIMCKQVVAFCALKDIKLTGFRLLSLKLSERIIDISHITANVC